MRERGAILAIKRKAEEKRKQTELNIQLVKELTIGKRYTLNTKSYKKNVKLVVEIVHYGTESLRIKLLACDIKTGLFFNLWQGATNQGEVRSQGVFTLMYKSILGHVPWEDIESPLLVNYEYIAYKFKQKLFKLEVTDE